MPADTTVPVSDEVWEALMRRKNRGDTFDDVLRRELGLDDDAEPGADDTLPDALAAAIDAYEPSGDVATQTARTALRDAVTWLRAHEGPAKKAAIVAGAKPADVSAQQWWARAARPGLAALAEQGLVERPTTKTYAIEKGEG